MKLYTAQPTYTYDTQRQRLQEMNLTYGGNAIMGNKYQYDAVDNILGISNDVSPTNSTKLGSASSHTYQYDKQNRLISATGSAKDASYTLNMAYNVMSMPLSKEQTTNGSKTAQSYQNYYKYEDEGHPTAPTQIGHDHYTYDANGKPTRVENDSTAAVREMYWDEDNRLMVLSDNGNTSRYTYNAAGERVIKSHGTMEGVYINGAPQGITFHEMDEYTLYPASILTVNKNRFTKHYFIGDKRIASRIGSGSFNNVYGRNNSYVTAGQQDYAERLNQIQSQKEAYYKELGIAPGVPTMKGAYGDPENTGVGYNTIITELGDHSVPETWVQYVNLQRDTETPGAPISWEDPISPEDPESGYGFIPDTSNELEETFFYHSDHLGSTSYITDNVGNITQYDAYLPYGELLVDEHSSSEDLPYKFNGKELDEDTGLYYYGARYMQPMASIWYGVDFLTEKYPAISPYSYCMGNPVKLVDSDGNAVKPNGAMAMSIILNTLPADARQYITIDKKGYLDLNAMNQYQGNSENFNSLKTLAQSDYDIQVTTTEETKYLSNGKVKTEKFMPVEIIEDFKDTKFSTSTGNTTGETGNLGVTYMPTNGGSGKADADNPNSIHININPSLSPTGAAETFSHEGYGHALVFVESGGDRNRAVHHFEGSHDRNLELVEKSISARKETINNIE